MCNMVENMAFFNEIAPFTPQNDLLDHILLTNRTLFVARNLAEVDSIQYKVSV